MTQDYGNVFNGSHYHNSVDLGRKKTSKKIHFYRSYANIVHNPTLKDNPTLKEGVSPIKIFQYIRTD